MLNFGSDLRYSRRRRWQQMNYLRLDVHTFALGRRMHSCCVSPKGDVTSSWGEWFRCGQRWCCDDDDLDGNRLKLKQAPVHTLKPWQKCFHLFCSASASHENWCRDRVGSNSGICAVLFFHKQQLSQWAGGFIYLGDNVYHLLCQGKEQASKQASTSRSCTRVFTFSNKDGDLENLCEKLCQRSLWFWCNHKSSLRKAGET